MILAGGEALQRRLEREMTEVSAAIDLVAAGVASRVAVAGISFGDEVAARMRAEAERRGVLLDAEPWAEDAGCDVIVRRVGR